MVHRSFLVLAITLISAHLSQQQQNLCGTDGTRIWVDDPSSCNAYLWCNWDRTVTPPTLTSVHQLDCRAQGSTFFRPDPTGTSGVCTDSFPECSATSMCPPAGTDEIMIANPDDATCREHRPCRSVSSPFSSCREPLVFNRNTGTCDFADRAPCNPFGSAPAGCPVGANGNYPGETCYSFILCENGAITGRFNCGTGLLFDQTERQCIPDSDPPACIRTFEIQRVKTVNALSGFYRFLRAVHLN
ncbi:unnamed protein product [Chironomus riparius]|uniref:Chitin-binding type-2 domain-containing protein n=1 Tax=Chironomus riparius TaxID=315576 RepID=A0A9N9S696_9DIPT|nr:unnamed protein product [Chironomus riparius]